MTTAILDAVPAGSILRPGRADTKRDIIGLDLGQSSDYTALALIERMLEPTGRFIDTGKRQLMQRTMQPPEMVPIVTPQVQPRLYVTQLVRFPLQTDYVAMAATVKAGIQQLIDPGRPKPILVIDHTGVGRGVFDIFRHLRMGVPLIGVTIHGGHVAKQDTDRPWEWSVPKKDLVSALQVVVQNDRLRVAPALEFARAFAEEMQNFKIEIKASGHVTYEAWRESVHDDLVLAVAMGCWMAERLDSVGGIY